MKGMLKLARETEAKRKRNKKSYDPANSRGTFGDFDTFVRKTPTMKLRQERKQNKYKKKGWEIEEDEY